LFTQSSPVREPLLQAFLFPSSLGEVTLHLLLRPACLFTVHVGSGSSPLSCGVFLSLLLLQVFPLLITGRVLQLLPTCVFVYSSRGKWVFPLSCGVFLPPPLIQAFLLLVAAAPAFSGLACLFSSGRDSHPPLFGAQGAPPSLLRVFIVLIAYYSVSLFFPGWGSVCPGGYADLAQGFLWEYHVPLSSPCGLCLPKPSEHWHLASWFLHLT
jgi:hypothetical protein